MAEDGPAKIEEVEAVVDYRDPLGVTYDEDGPDDHVRVSIIFPGLKKRTLKNEPKNGKIEELKFEKRSLTLKVSMKKKDAKKAEHFKYTVKKLPDVIDPEKSYHKIKENQVVLYLRKVESRSWARELSEAGLETYDEDEEDQGGT